MDDVVKTLIDAIVRQGEFLVSLATAVVGGCIALIGWQVSKSGESTNRQLRWMVLIVIALVLMVASIVAFYFGFGRIITLYPEFSFIKAAEAKTPLMLKEMFTKAGIGDAQFFFGWQLIFFALSGIALMVFAVRNGWILMTAQAQPVADETNKISVEVSTKNPVSIKVEKET